jgi:hypothetical protein
MVVFLTLLFFGFYSEANNNLSQGIMFLEQDNLSSAQKMFHQISFPSSEWQTKVLALMRYHFAKRDYQEVWRIGQVLNRTGRVSEEQKLLMKSAMYLHQSCILDTDSTIEGFDYLLDAATYRFPNKYSTQSTEWGESFQAWDEGHHRTALSSSLNFYLTEIPKAKLLSGQGCSKLRFGLDDKLRAKKGELHAIIGFFETRSQLKEQFKIQPRFELLLLARGLELSHTTKIKEPLLDDELEKMSLASLIELPDPERRFLWSARMATKPWSDAETFKFIKQTILTSTDPATADWLAQLDLNKVALADRIFILEKLLEYQQLSENNFLLLQLAEAYWLRQDTKKTLRVLRRLLIEGFGQTDQTIELASLDLAAQIFSELKWDESVMGAMQASLPKALWVGLHLRVLKQAAYKGEKIRFEQILKRLGRNSSGGQQVELLRSLAYRNLTTFKKLLLNVGPAKNASLRLSRHALSLLDDLAAAQFDFSPATIKSLGRFYDEIVKVLRQVLENPMEEDEHLQQLVYAFSQAVEGQWIEGNATVRRGIIKAGKVSLKEEVLIVCPFKLAIPKTLPLRELIFKPVGIAPGQWVLE